MDAFLATILLFGGNFAPRNWAFCHGQLIAISSNQALFALLGTTYGGDGRTSFGLPDLRGRVPVGHGQGPGLTSRSLGQSSGVEQTSVSLTSQNVPTHTHPMHAIANSAGEDSPANNYLGQAEFYATGGTDVTMNANSIGANAGGAEPIVIPAIQPSLSMNYIICIDGIFPSRN